MLKFFLLLPSQELRQSTRAGLMLLSSHFQATIRQVSNYGELLHGISMCAKEMIALDGTFIHLVFAPSAAYKQQRMRARNHCFPLKTLLQPPSSDEASLGSFAAYFLLINFQQ